MGTNQRTKVVVYQTLHLEYEIEVDGEVNKEKVQEKMDELGYPDATTMVDTRTWFQDFDKNEDLVEVDL